MASLIGEPIHFPFPGVHPTFPIHGFGPGGVVTYPPIPAPNPHPVPVPVTGGPAPVPLPVAGPPVPMGAPGLGRPRTDQTGIAGAHHGENYSPLASFLSGHQGEIAPGITPSAPANDEANATNVAAHLSEALNRARDPNLKESLSNALAAIHKHISGLQKERHQALQGKLSPRMMEAAHGFNLQGANGGGPMIPAGAPAPGQHIDTGYNPAQYQLAIGNTAQAAADWEAHHPWAMAHNQLPGWLSAYLAAQLAQHVNPAASTTAPAGNTFAAQ